MPKAPILITLADVALINGADTYFAVHPDLSETDPFDENQHPSFTGDRVVIAAQFAENSPARSEIESAISALGALIAHAAKREA